MIKEEITYTELLRNLGRKHLDMAMKFKIKQISEQSQEVNLKNIKGGLFDDLEEYVYIIA